MIHTYYHSSLSIVRWFFKERSILFVLKKALEKSNMRRSVFPILLGAQIMIEVLTIIHPTAAFLKVDRYFQRRKLSSFSVPVRSLGSDYLNSLQRQPQDALQDTSHTQAGWNPHPGSSTVSDTGSRTVSLSRVSYQQVAEGLDVLYPPTELATRNAKSRSDGYWPFISQKDEPPAAFTYGEFDALFFAELLDDASSYFSMMPSDSSSATSWDDKIVCDIGSGTGRLVIGAAALHPGLATSRGIEILPGIHNMAIENAVKCQQSTGQYVLPPYNLPMAPIELTCGSISDPNIDIGNVDLFFIASTCMPESVLVDIAHTIGRQCRIGTLVISTDYELITERTFCESNGRYFRLEKLNQKDGYCWIVGGVSTAHIYRLVETAAPP